MYKYSLMTALALGIAAFLSDAQAQSCTRQCRDVQLECRQGCIDKFGVYAAPETGYGKCANLCDESYAWCVRGCAKETPQK